MRKLSVLSLLPRTSFLEDVGAADENLSNVSFCFFVVCASGQKRAPSLLTGIAVSGLSSQLYQLDLNGFGILSSQHLREHRLFPICMQTSEDLFLKSEKEGLI